MTKRELEAPLTSLCLRSRSGTNWDGLEGIEVVRTEAGAQLVLIGFDGTSRMIPPDDVTNISVRHKGDLLG